MQRYLVILIGICATSNVGALDDAQCSKYHYEELILLNQIRLDIDNFGTKVGNIVQSQACTACDDGWITFQSSCYLFGTNNVEFDAAEAFCKLSGSHLVSIQNWRENDFIMGHLAELSAEKFWIGMTDTVTENSWRWIDTNEEVQFYNWGSGEPNQGRDANCAAIWHSLGNKYVDVRCTERQNRPICKKVLT